MAKNVGTYFVATVDDNNVKSNILAERMNQSESPVTETLFSNLNSTLDQSSSLLSSGSLIDECKRNAIESLKKQSKSECSVQILLLLYTFS